MLLKVIVIDMKDHCIFLSHLQENYLEQLSIMSAHFPR